MEEAGSGGSLRWEHLTRTSVALTAIAYGLGFVIVATNHFRFGIAEFSILKPRIFAAGIVFLILAGVPALVALRSFNLYGLRRVTGTTVESLPHQRLWLILLVTVGFYFPSWIMAEATKFLFVDLKGLPQSGISLPPIVSVVVGFLILLPFIATDIIRRNFAKAPRASVLLCALAVVGFLLVLLIAGDRLFLKLTLWFYVVGLSVAYILWRVDAPKELRSFEFEYLALLLLPIVIGWYSTNIYPRIKALYGGGSPVQARLVIGRESQTTVNILVLEETEQGYYLLRSPTSKSAIFVPRSEVRLIYFGEEKDPLK